MVYQTLCFLFRGIERCYWSIYSSSIFHYW